MADLKISQLTDGGASQATDEYVIARSGANYRIDGASVAAAATSVGTLTSLTVSGDLTVDTSTLKVDSTNNRVGVGTASPAAPLHVAQSSSAVLFSQDSTTATIVGTNAAGNSSQGLFLRGFPLTFTGNGGGGAEQMRLDASGNLGLGVTPKGWSVDFPAIQVGQGAAFWAADNFPYAYMSANSYYNGTNHKFITNGAASWYVQELGAHKWFSNSNSPSVDGNITFVERMTLDASGNLGVGTTPTNYGAGYTQFVVRGSSIPIIDLTVDTTRTLSFVATATDSTLKTVTNTPLLFATNDTERARITSGGYFKASDTGTYISATGTYHEFDQTAAGSPAMRVYASSGSYADYVMYLEGARAAGNNYYFLRCVNNADRLLIQDDGDVTNSNGTYGTISDAKLKQDIVDAPSQWDDLKAIRFRKYRMKAEVETNPDAPYMLGVVAQELEQVSPGLVHEHPDFEEQEVTDEDGNVTTEKVQVGTTKSVKSSILLMKAAVALQEAMARIEALEARLEALEA